jgi:hypothetical protein
MSCDKKKPVTGAVVRYLASLLLACATLLAAPAFAVDSGDIIVVSQKGEVHITVNGAARKVAAGGVLELPATVRTGRDGNIELRQGATSVSVGPDTLLEFPALEKRGAPIDRILQPRGNAFYDIGKREGRKLRVETPYLVGVIKGTQFNVAAQDESTTISLFEGLLEVHASDNSDVVDLKAGEIASRSRGDKSIHIIKMDPGKAPSTAPRAPGTSSGNGTPGPTIQGASPPIDRLVNDMPGIGGSADLRNGGTSVEPGAAEVSPAGADVAVAASVDASPVIADPGVSPAVDVSTGAVDVSAGTAVDVSAGTAVDVGVATVAVDTSTSVDLAAGAVDVAASSSVDAGVATAAVDTGASVDLGAGTVDTSTSVGVDAGPLTTDVATGVAVDVPAGTVDVDASLIVGASAPLVEVNVGSDVAVDTVAGTVNLGLDVAGANIDLGVDTAGTVDTVETVVETVTDSVTETVTDTVVDVGGLLDGLLRRPGRK